MTSIDRVKEFWEESPLWTGESKYQVGSIDFFQEHKKVYFEDCFAGWVGWFHYLAEN